MEKICWVGTVGKGMQDGDCGKRIEGRGLWERVEGVDCGKMMQGGD